jgi:O-antigen/teichoic acid export membrane protein
MSVELTLSKTVTGDRLEKEELRIHYSGAIVFAAKLMTIGTGIIFTLAVVSSLSQSDYGAFGVFVNIVIPYFTILSGPIAFWTMRFAARDQKGALKTGIAGNIVISALATLIYFAALPLVTASQGLEKYVLVYVVAAAQIIELYLVTVIEAGLQAKRPHLVGYGLLVGEILKVVFVYLFVVRLQLALFGAILSIIVAYCIKVGFYFDIVKDELKQNLALGYVKEWLKGSTFNLYSIAGDRLASTIFFMLLFYGGTVGYSYYYAPSQIATIITYSTFLAFALTPRLLTNSNIDEATASLKNVLMVAVPMTTGVLTIPGSYLAFFVESGEYTVAAPVLMILAVDALVSTISTVYTYILYGIERVDEKAEIPFGQVARSRLFIAFSLPYVHSAISLPIALYALGNVASNNLVLMAIFVTAITLAARSVAFIILYGVLRKSVRVKVPWKSIGKYVAASLVMALILFFAHPVGRPLTLFFTGIGGMTYIVLLLVIDKESRTLARTVLQMVKARAHLTPPVPNPRENSS